LYHLQIANLQAQTNSFVYIYSVIIKISSALTLTTAATNNNIQLKLLSPKISSFIISIEEESRKQADELLLFRVCGTFY
jgi:hypothetical protein